MKREALREAHAREARLPPHLEGEVVAMRVFVDPCGLVTTSLKYWLFILYSYLNILRDIFFYVVE